MIWALLALVGVPIWLILGALSGAIVSRRRFKAQPHVFALLIREHGADGWPRLVSYGRYVHDVLLVNSGLALVRTSVHAVERLDPLELDGPAGKLKEPRGWTVTLDDGGRYDIAVSSVDATRVAAG